MKVHSHKIIWLRDGKVFLEYHYTYGMLRNMFEYDTSGDSFSNFNFYNAENNFFGSPFFIPAEWKYDAQTHQLSTPNQAMESEEDEKVGYFIESCNEEELIMRVEYGEPMAWGHDSVRFIYIKESETPVQYRDFNSRKEFDLWFEQLVADWRASVNNK